VTIRSGGVLLVAAVLALPAPALAAADAELAAVKAELASTKQELAATKDTLRGVVQRLDALEASSAGAAAATPATGPRIAPVNADNPAISFVVDTTLSGAGGDPGWNFALRSGELFVSAPIDPFLRGYATLNGSSEEGFDIEEAALLTTSLPWGLTVKGGRFFADVGRLPHWHDEALPFVDRPPSLERLFGGEASAEGAETTWLAPTEQFLQVTTGVYNSVGSIPDEVNANTDLDGRRDLGELTWLVHPETYLDITDTWNVELGGTFLTVPQGGQRRLWGFDATLRHQPGTSQFYQGLVLGSEWYWSDEKFRDVEMGTDPITGDAILGNRRFTRNGGYAYLEAFFGRRFSAGVRGDYAQEIAGNADTQRSGSLFLTWKPSEFQRLRLQGDLFDRAHGNDQRITLQWTAFLGSHSHGFAMR